MKRVNVLRIKHPERNPSLLHHTVSQAWNVRSGPQPRAPRRQQSTPISIRERLSHLATASISYANK